MPRKQSSRQTHLKIRAIPLVRMPQSVFFRKIRESCKNGVIAEDIEITTLQWDHGVGRRYRAGTVLSGEDAEELRNCYRLLTSVGKSDIRVEKPS